MRRRKKLPAEARMYFIGMAQQKYQDRKSQLYDDYDYDRISRKEYERLLEEARLEYQATLKMYK